MRSLSSCLDLNLLNYLIQLSVQAHPHSVCSEVSVLVLLYSELSQARLAEFEQTVKESRLLRLWDTGDVLFSAGVWLVCLHR